jgi:hypothetical protein
MVAANNKSTPVLARGVTAREAAEVARGNQVADPIMDVVVARRLDGVRS